MIPGVEESKQSQTSQGTEKNISERKRYGGYYIHAIVSICQ